MKYYSHFGFSDFIICVGYKGHMIKEFFGNYWQHNADVCINVASNSVIPLKAPEENWTVSIINTGLDTMTGGRLLRIKEHLKDDIFMMTYGDGVGDVDLHALVDFHRGHGKLATVTGTNPSGRFGVLGVDGDSVYSFSEKTDNVDSWISSGFFVLSPKVLDYVEGDCIIWEHEPLKNLATDGQLMVYKHRGSWMAMDTLRDKLDLEKLWKKDQAFWKVW
jgi:glucose-1-phosphate cytidylyltransferase